MNNGGAKITIGIDDLKSKKLIKLISDYVCAKVQVKVAEEKAKVLFEKVEPLINELKEDSISGYNLSLGDYELSKSLRIEKTYDISVTKKIEEIKQRAEQEGKITMTPKQILSLRFLKGTKSKDE